MTEKVNSITLQDLHLSTSGGGPSRIIGFIMVHGQNVIFHIVQLLNIRQIYQINIMKYLLQAFHNL